MPLTTYLEQQAEHWGEHWAADGWLAQCAALSGLLALHAPPDACALPCTLELCDERGGEGVWRLGAEATLDLLLPLELRAPTLTVHPAMDGSGDERILSCAADVNPEGFTPYESGGIQTL